VVGGDFHVHGTKNLYVVDASVFETIPNGNVHATVAASAMKAAEGFLLEMREGKNKNE
tara:strand:- start:159 stop:332 length:174 start_codon:yes stop_codon:yes gene_type:complete